MDPLVSELGQALPLFEEQLEEVRGEASTALYVAQTQLLQPNDRAVLISSGCIQSVCSGSTVLFHVRPLRGILTSEAVQVFSQLGHWVFLQQLDTQFLHLPGQHRQTSLKR
ncbi:hypothetical protein EYF80_004384 [Liparis tanakae]|uniref:Uncharacterized protein n=1 Tax=Liparis tanakae TaxID=230148 RepID=A0A4Z2J7E7_9TELE|nr:hypothetical protein EYF80_004384 [Liparis tanakae]